MSENAVFRKLVSILGHTVNISTSYRRHALLNRATKRAMIHKLITGSKKLFSSRHCESASLQLSDLQNLSIRRRFEKDLEDWKTINKLVNLSKELLLFLFYQALQTGKLPVRKTGLILKRFKKKAVPCYPVVQKTCWKVKVVKGLVLSYPAALCAGKMYRNQLFLKDRKLRRYPAAYQTFVYRLYCT